MTATLDWLGCATFRLTIRRVFLGHHDDWLAGFSKAVDARPIRAEIARREPHAELVEMDYLAAFPIFANLPTRPR